MAPVAVFNRIHSKSVQALDVSHEGFGVSAGTDGRLLVWESGTGEVRRSLSGHLGDVYVAKFFPSGLVALTGGADMMLKIWSIETGECARTMIGHRYGKKIRR